METERGFNKLALCDIIKMGFGVYFATEDNYKIHYAFLSRQYISFNISHPFCRNMFSRSQARDLRYHFSNADLSLADGNFFYPDDFTGTDDLYFVFDLAV